MMKKLITSCALIVTFIAVNSCDSVSVVMDDMREISTFPETKEARTDKLLNEDCPRVEIVEDLSSLSEFSSRRDPSYDNLISRVNLTHSESSCFYGPRSVTVDLKLAFEGVLGPRARMQPGDRPFFSYPFFVAVTAPNGDILAKEVFGAAITYESGQDRQTYYESLRQVIPAANTFRGSRHKVLIGFQLSQDQLEYNRQMIRSVTFQEPKDVKPAIIRRTDPLESSPGAPIPLSPPPR